MTLKKNLRKKKHHHILYMQANGQQGNTIINKEGNL